MLVAYILTRSRFLKVKIIKGNAGVFKYKDYEYNIKRDRIYQKKFMGLKIFFWCFYLEGFKEPLEFKEGGYDVGSTDVALDEIGYLMRKIRRGLSDIIFMILNGGTLILVLLIFLKIFGYLDKVAQ